MDKIEARELIKQSYDRYTSVAYPAMLKLIKIEREEHETLVAAHHSPEAIARYAAVTRPAEAKYEGINQAARDKHSKERQKIIAMVEGEDNG